MPSIIPLNSEFSSLAEHAYTEIKQKIFNFEMMPGDLISEGNLAKLVSVSRTPLRQALQQLQHGGFIRAIPKIGWQVATLDFDKFDELYDFRILIELNAVKCLCISQQDNLILNELIKIVRRLDFTKNNRIHDTYDEHAQIIKAIMKRKTSEVQKLLKNHIEQSKIEVRKITVGMLQEAKKQASG